ncbi:MAG: 50S ribosomal protein L32 [Myxococcales bacterium]|nr:50S ribosomal protein L32 [Myxococcales bacterium]MCB9708705.1 50S ribosomal protein L32 [Myxococcales bacterium]
MAVPKRRTSRSRRDMRRANHQRITAPAMSVCPACGETSIPHRACPSCGQYRGREVVSVAVDGT